MIFLNRPQEVAKSRANMGYRLCKCRPRIFSACPDSSNCRIYLPLCLGTRAWPRDLRSAIVIGKGLNERNAWPVGPISDLVAIVVEVAMMIAAKGDREFVAGPMSERSGLRKLQMMRAAW
jgi:hypothetical protein